MINNAQEPNDTKNASKKENETIEKYKKYKASSLLALGFNCSTKVTKCHLREEKRKINISNKCI